MNTQYCIPIPIVTIANDNDNKVAMIYHDPTARHAFDPDVS